VIKAGADATGTTSGIMKAVDPEAMMEEMISAVRSAWDERCINSNNLLKEKNESVQKNNRSSIKRSQARFS
jgi:pyridoxal biosynthesis lyase PdxS